MLILNNKEVVVKKFPNGESFIDLKDILVNEYINEIKLRFESNEDIAHLIFLKGYLDEKNLVSSLIIPYIPYSRMDRTEGVRVFTLKYFIRLINSMNYESVTVYEPHSDVCVALLDRVRVVDMTIEITKELIGEVSSKSDTDLYLVYPDAGAAKRYSKQINCDKVLTANKERDFNTGYINKLEISGKVNFNSFNAIIVDDLCSKGGTFMMTAKKLKEMGAMDIYLVVTHCENTIFDGEILSSDLISKVYTTNSILNKEDKKILVKKII